MFWKIDGIIWEIVGREETIKDRALMITRDLDLDLTEQGKPGKKIEKVWPVKVKEN